MTINEAISIMNVIVHMIEPQYDTDRIEKAVEMAIKALEQPTCDDAVSRQAVLDTIGNVPDYDDGMVWEALSHAQRDVALLPSVTQQPKGGHWKRISRDMYVQHAMAYYECSECGKKMIGTHNYCPNCGAKMQEVEE